MAERSQAGETAGVSVQIVHLSRDMIVAVFLFFVDGLGIEKADTTINPCINDDFDFLNIFNIQHPIARSLGGFARPVQATLGISGLPQSATGQTTLLSGINASGVLNKHLPGFPNEKLRTILKEHSLLKQIKELGFKPTFLNAYRPQFFNLKPQTQWRMSATTVATLAADIPFKTFEDLRQKRALYHDLTGESLIEKGFGVPILSEKQAANIVREQLNQYDFILYEYFMTDRAGHKQDHNLATQLLRQVDAFLKYVIESIDLNKHHVILTSDHGNIEDLSTRSHTRNPAMTLIWGPSAKQLTEQLESLEDFAPAILNLLKETAS